MSSNDSASSGKTFGNTRLSSKPSEFLSSTSRNITMKREAHKDMSLTTFHSIKHQTRIAHHVSRIRHRREDGGTKQHKKNTERQTELAHRKMPDEMYESSSICRQCPIFPAEKNVTPTSENGGEGTARRISCIWATYKLRSNERPIARLIRVSSLYKSCTYPCGAT